MAKTKNVKDQKDLINYVKDVTEKPKKTTTKTSNKNTVVSNESKFVVKYTFNLKDYLTQDELTDRDIYNEYVSQLTPKYAHPGDIGMDITAISVEYDDEYDRYIYHTGFYCETPELTGCFVMPRSSNSKTEGYLCNGIGLADTFIYRGELCLMFKNRTSLSQKLDTKLLENYLDLPWYKKLFTKYSDFKNEQYHCTKCGLLEDIMNNAPYQVGERIGQLVWMKFPKVDMKLVDSVDDLSKTIRGAGGFGSTGK
jgi:dUTPase